MTDMETRLRQRLDALTGEFEKGKKTIEELEGQAGDVRATMLRISGAIQVLREELGLDEASGGNPDDASPAA